jgi:SAM-dependent methyltransferase
MVRCGDCRLVFANHDPAVGTEDYTEHYYDRWGIKPAEEERIARMKRLNYGRLLDLLPGIRSVLDIGCALGFSVEEALARNLDAFGIEVNPYAVEFARRRLGDRVRFKSPDRTFDAVTMVDVLEHVSRAETLLDIARRALRPGGRLILTTPDVTSPSSRILGPRWPHFTREHLLYFDRATLRAALKAAGFRTLRVHGFVKVLTPGYFRSMLTLRTDSALSGTARRLVTLLPRWFDGWSVPISTGDMMALARREPGNREGP